MSQLLGHSRIDLRGILAAATSAVHLRGLFAATTSAAHLLLVEGEILWDLTAKGFHQLLNLTRDVTADADHVTDRGLVLCTQSEEDLHELAKGEVLASILVAVILSEDEISKVNNADRVDTHLFQSTSSLIYLQDLHELCLAQVAVVVFVQLRKNSLQLVGDVKH
eukprot:CAMPEP_0181536752 /NCGR_PEP_ID=MMETSP1110-20121109/74995_1 /TAXON_ID=174948 /ORGANISM="Symbiodinium sp., Strain CCMP421" /LENGTH=164 /DNA_ID=CAMNT_0023668297 /DNA_START=48 /DNA_END=542 /DNA_ORIENTATION=-